MNSYVCVCVNRGVFSSLSALETEPKKNHMCRKVMEKEEKKDIIMRHFDFNFVSIRSIYSWFTALSFF